MLQQLLPRTSNVDHCACLVLLHDRQVLAALAPEALEAAPQRALVALGAQRLTAPVVVGEREIPGLGQTVRSWKTPPNAS